MSYPIIPVYVDASDNCNTATFQLGRTAVGTTTPARSWNLKVLWGLFYLCLEFKYL